MEQQKVKIYLEINFSRQKLARVFSRFNRKNSTRFSRIEDSLQNRQILPCQLRVDLHDSWLNRQDLSILLRIQGGKSRILYFRNTKVQRSKLFFLDFYSHTGQKCSVIRKRKKFCSEKQSKNVLFSGNS